MPSFVVTYPADAARRFDGGYYLDTHMPLVEARFGPHGLTGARAFLPEGENPAYAAIAILDFRDDAAFDAAFASADAATVMGDVANFTDIKPITQRCR